MGSQVVKMGKNTYGYETPELIKSVWRIELDIVKELDRICKKHGLKYVMDFGTLLGAVRHEGFIPWDDDMDFSMLRADYEKLKEIAPAELPEYYFLQTPYNDGIMANFLKIRDSRTTAIEFFQLDPGVNQGISIDIFPMDDVPEDKDTDTKAFLMQKEMIGVITHPDAMIKLMQDGTPTALPYDLLITFIKSNPVEVFRQYEAFCAGQVGTSEYVDSLLGQIGCRRIPCKKEWFENPVELPFEDLILPAPQEYETVLRLRFGDYMKIPEDKGGHQAFYDLDKPWYENMNQA